MTEPKVRKVLIDRLHSMTGMLAVNGNFCCTFRPPFEQGRPFSGRLARHHEIGSKN
jgi:hypothetical protein